MAIFSRLFRNEVKEIVDITNENAELKRGLGDLLLLIISKDKVNLHLSMKNNDPLLSHIFTKVRQLIEENQSLKSEKQ